MEVAYIETIKGLVKAGLGISILPDKAVEQEILRRHPGEVENTGCRLFKKSRGCLSQGQISLTSGSGISEVSGGKVTLYNIISAVGSAVLLVENARFSVPKAFGISLLRYSLESPCYFAESRT